MKPGVEKLLFLNFLLLFLFFSTYSESADKIESAPLINLEDISPTFEEEKDELEKIGESESTSNEISIENNILTLDQSDKIYVNLKTLDKITAKTYSIKIAVGEKKSFGELEIAPLKCALSKSNDSIDTIAYLQIKDLSMKNNDQVFIFNGWTFASSTTLNPIDHPIYDLWLVGCGNS